MQLTLKLTGTRVKDDGRPLYGGRKPETEPYTHAEIVEMSGPNRAIANALRALADDLDPQYLIAEATS